MMGILFGRLKSFRNIRPLIGLHLFLLTIIHPTAASAREMLGRMGIGYNAQFSQTLGQNGAPGVSLKYGFAPKMMMEVIGGFSSGSGGTGVAAVKIMPTIHAENYVNFYYIVGAGHVAKNPRTGMEWIGGAGAELFLPGAESVGLSFETGISAENVTTGSYIVKTFGVSFVHAGMHFYF